MRTTNPIKLNIKGDIFDGYLYCGHLFVVMNDGFFGKVSLEKLLHKYFSNNYELYYALFISFVHSDWLTNKQGITFLGIDTIRSSWENIWDKYSKLSLNEEISIHIKHDDLDFISTFINMPPLDIKLYNMRAYLGGRGGVDETVIKQTKNGKELEVGKTQKVSEIDTNFINAKYGSILISSIKDGLFLGNLWENNLQLILGKNPIRKTSTRTGWVKNDLVNYESNTIFSYLQNKYENDSEGRYKAQKEDSERKLLFTEIGQIKREWDDLMPPINKEEISYSFNDKDWSYFFTNTGDLKKAGFKTIPSGEIQFKSRLNNIPISKSQDNQTKKILSVNVFYLGKIEGYVIEYIDRVTFLTPSKSSELLTEKCDVISVRTYPNSIRYKNVVSIFHEEGVFLYSFPNFYNATDT